ncbi:LAFE_0B05204g1_1 [Lachancea fermentati]|uniref:LAFE_0B05204g1_1 n=1 Tax=Lachancea fermentati TaxID=4955 RepID=A0A1G4M836_LACFM|nr:LAFE_0B05204g1_1 [Lachancea fermentati]
MKFAEHLRESAVPEWSDKYIDYKRGKKKLKSCTKSILASKVLINNISAIGGNSSDSQSARWKNSYTHIQRHFIQEFVQDWVIGRELEKCNDFYLWQLRQCMRRYAILEEQIRIYEMQQSNQSYGAVQDYVQYPIVVPPTRTSHSLRARAVRQLQQLDLMPSLPNCINLKDLLGHRREHGPPSVIHGETFTPVPVKLTPSQIKQQLSDALIEYYLLIQLVKNYRELNVTGFRKIVKKFDKTCGTTELPNFMEYAKAHSPMFQHAEANVHLLTQQIQDSNLIKRPSISTDASKDATDPLFTWEQQVTHWYTEVLSTNAKDRKHKTEKIRNLSLQYSLNEQKIHKFNTSILQIFVAGSASGAGLTLVAYTLYKGFLAPVSSKVHTYLLPLWGGWYMVYLMVYLLLLACFIWHRTHVNYRFIMFGEVHSRHGAVLFNNDFSTTNIPLLLYCASVFLLPFSILGAISFHYEVLTPWAIAWPICAAVLFLWPSIKASHFLALPYWDKLRQTRRWLIVTAIRLLCSGMFPVQFGDFFLGDIVNSLTYTMADIALFFCVYSDTPMSNCGSSHSKVMGILSCIPSYWRMMQCFRRYADSGDWFPHLLNGFKYGMGVAFNASLCAYRLSHTDTRRGVFVALAAINGTVSAIWDIIMDWSLLQPNSHNWLLRDDLYLAGRRNWKNGSYSRRRKLVYYFAMIWDVMIRFEWIVYAVAPSTIQQNAITSFAMAFFEVLRRFVWVIFRVENEHVANVHLFKVSGEISLPYPTTIPLESDTEEAIDEDYALADIDYPEEPTRAYPGAKSGRTTSFIDNVSKVIPWAHARDFQRPRSYSAADANSHESDESESEMESMV